MREGAEFRELMLQVVRTRMAFRRSMQRTLKKNNAGITFEMLQVLSSLWHEQGISQQILAERIAKDKACLTNLMNNLEKKGYVCRKEDPNDRRNKLVFLTPADNRGIDNTGVHAIADLSELKNNKKLPYEVKIKLKGSQSINFIPLGKTTRVDLKANWNTPSFTGSYLPNNRDITEKEFSAQWQVLNLNRNYSQVMIDYTNFNIKNIDNSSFGVNFKIPVEQYQQSMRSAKYAILIILLTFGVIFFTEIMNKTRIHALLYLLVGLALCLFYSLLLSFSEHIGFNPAYLLSATLTIILVGGYMFGITKRKKPSLIMSGLLGVLYLYIFVLIQLETFALLTGSLGLFIILAMVMYFSKKIDWFNE